MKNATKPLFALKQFRWHDLFFLEDQDIFPPANEIEVWFRRVCVHGEEYRVEAFPGTQKGTGAAQKHAKASVSLASGHAH